MKRKKINMYFSIIFLIIFILIIGYFIVKNKNKIKNNKLNDYIPEEEISDEQLRKTNIILYFENKETGELSTEIRQIDSRKLLKNSGKTLLEFLIEGPISENLNKLIPEGTKIIDTNIDKGILIVNFSEEFIKINLGEEKEKLIINSIIKTIEQITEVNGIKILINNEENKGFPDDMVKFDQIFKIY